MCHSKNIYDLGRDSTGRIACRQCHIEAADEAIREAINDFHPIVFSGQIHLAIVNTPSRDEVPCNMEALEALQPNPNREAGAPIRLVEVPLQFPNADNFVQILSQFVIEERRCGNFKTKSRSYGPVPVTWRGPKQFYFSAKKTGIRQLRLGMEVAVGDPSVPGVVFSKSVLGNVTVHLRDQIPHTEKLTFRLIFSAIPYDRQSQALAYFPRVDKFWQDILIGDLSNSREEVDPRFRTNLSESTLNTSQQEAVSYALTHRFVVIQGPPGTGKSTCAAVQAVAQTKLGMRVLVVARTNEGANNLTAKLAPLLETGLIRVVGETYQGGEIPDDIVPFCSHLDLPGGNKFKKRKAEEIRINESCLVVTTSCCAGGSRLTKEGFHSVIIDEANQLVDPEFAILLRFDPTFVTLYGDHAQIGPYVESIRAKNLGYGKSLIERLPEIEALGRTRDPPVDYPHFILREQYRMHPTLAEFPSREFYEGVVESAPDLVREINVGIPFPNPDVPLVFVNVAGGREQKSSDGSSTLNLAEIVAVGNVLASLYGAGVPPESIGVVSFYAAAVDAAVDLLPKLGIADPDFLEPVEIQTVDAYEGREKDYIILMCVRANTVHQIGFLNNTGRMNVALTRAKFGLFVVGNRETLRSEESGPVWARFIEHCETRHVIVDEWPPL
jgi:regulator of nonsense transcripts 1